MNILNWACSSTTPRKKLEYRKSSGNSIHTGEENPAPNKPMHVVVSTAPPAIERGANSAKCTLHYSMALKKVAVKNLRLKAFRFEEIPHMKLFSAATSSWH